jgi:single-strand DNA-binding protein
MQKTTIAGTVSQVRELKQVGDKQVFNFSVAVSNGKNADGSWRDSTFWDCAVWDKRADAVSRFLTKGTKIAVIGRPAARAHEGKAYLQLTVDDFTLLGGGEQGGQSSGGSQQEQSSGGYDDNIPF